jgi:hypothetical protein
MRFPGFIGASYNLDSVAIDAQRCVNWFLRVTESGSGKEGDPAALIDRPGYDELVNVGDGLPQRGSIETTTGVYYTVNGGRLFKVDEDFEETEIGVLSTSEGHVSMADNGIHLAIVDGTYFYKITLADDTFERVDDNDLECYIQVLYLDGYFIFIGEDKFQISDLLSTEVEGLEFGTSEGSPDAIVGGETLEEDLYVFNTRTTEVFFNSGNADFPFEPKKGAFLEIGLGARFSLAKSKDHLFFIGRDKDGSGMVYKARGANMEKISTFVIDQKIASYGDISNAKGYVYQDEGVSFYVLNFDNADTTWVYDINSGLWHERTFTNDGVQERDRGYSHAYAYSTHMVGDYESGKIYKMSREFFSDDGEEIVCVRTCPHVSDTGKKLKHKSFELDMERGTGLDGLGQGTDPQAMLTFSNDGGYSYNTEIWKPIGKIGERNKRIVWHRLGQAYDRVYKLQISDPVRRVLLGVNLELEAEAS